MGRQDAHVDEKITNGLARVYTIQILFPNISDTNFRSKTLRTEIISCLQEYMKNKRKYSY